MQCRSFAKKEMWHADIGLLLHSPRKSPNYLKSEGNIARESYPFGLLDSIPKDTGKKSTATIHT